MAVVITGVVAAHRCKLLRPCVQVRPSLPARLCLLVVQTSVTQAEGSGQAVGFFGKYVPGA